MKNILFILTTVTALSITSALFWKNTHSPDTSKIQPHQYALFSNTSLNEEPIQPIPETRPLNAQKVALGNALFHDKNLSKNKTLACATCHDLSKGGTDQLPLPITAAAQQAKSSTLPVFNTPTIFNASFNFMQTWKGTAKTLEEQIAIPLFNPFEMGNKSWARILNYINQSPKYASQFQAIYSEPVSSKHVIDAIAEFERSLITPNALFDLYLKGDALALTPYELEGYQLFKDRGCISCHHGINIGGNMFQRAGIFKPMFEKGVHGQEQHKNMIQTADNQTLFKVPSLRNIALTAPYFHNGSVENLEEAIDIMAKHQLGITLPIDENNKIHAFLKTLTGQYQGKSLSDE